MLDKTPAKEEMVALIGQPLYAVWQDLCAVIDAKYDMERLWNNGGKAWTYESKSFHLGIELNEIHKIIGEIWIYLIENDRMAKIAIRFGKPYHGKGYATEAVDAMVRFCFDHTELNRIWTDVDVNNISSCKMLEKCGFTREGTIRQGKMVSTWCDYHLYGILKSDVISPDD